MKKTLFLIVVMIAAIGLIVMVGCSKKTESPAAPSGPAATMTSTQMVASPTATVTPTTLVPVVVGFDSGIGSWGVPNPLYTTEQALTAPVWDSVDGHTSAGCLQETYTYDTSVNSADHTAGDAELGLGANFDLTGHTITMWVKVDAAMATTSAYSAQIYVKNDNTCSPNYGYSSGGWVDLTTTNWTQLTFVVDSGVAANGNANKTCISTIGMQVYRNRNLTNAADDVTGGVILFDDVSY